MVQAAQVAAASTASNSFPLLSPMSTANGLDLPYFFTPLPRQRSKLLPPSKEFQSRTWLDSKMTRISRRFLRKFGESVSAAHEPASTRPYQSIDEVCHALDEVVNFLWTTATPAIEVPYMLTIADDFIKYAKAFPPSPGPTFQLLHKLDFCFASMLASMNLDTREPLPIKPFLTVTDMVRLKGIAERTRLEVVPLFDSFDLDDEDPAAFNGQDQGEDMEDFNSYTTYDDDDYDGLYRPEQTACAMAQVQMQTPGPSTADEDSDFEPEDDILAGAVPRPSRRQSLSQGFSQGLETSRQPRRWDEDEEDELIGLEIGRVYEKTIVQLGKVLDIGTLR